MPYKDKERRREYMREYHQKYYPKYREEILAKQKKHDKIYGRKHRAFSQIYRESMKAIRDILGNECALCGSPKNLCVHEYYFKKHPYGNGLLPYVRKHSQDFIITCRLHHSMIHGVYN